MLFEHIKERAVRLALRAFIAHPSVGKCPAKDVFKEIHSCLQAGMDDDEALKAIGGSLLGFPHDRKDAV